MKPHHFYPFLLLGALSVGTGVLAQMPTTPAPTVTMSGPPTGVSPLPSTVQPNQVVYGETLPSAQELTNAAAAQGLKVVKIEQSTDQTVAVYRTADGQTTTVAYDLLPAANATATAPSVTIANNAAPEVIYTPPTSSVYYYASEPYYYGPYFGYPYSSVGIDLRLGGRGGYYRGGYYHGGYYRGGGHWHR